jgi:hypothetical protein
MPVFHFAVSALRLARSWARAPGRRGLRLARALLVLLFLTTSCAWQDWAVSTSDDSVGAASDQTGLIVCPNGVEYRNQNGYGNGISDLEVSPSGFQFLIRYRWHTFAGPSTKVRERIEFTIP